MERPICQLRETGIPGNLIGEAPAFVQALGQLSAIAKSEAAVLITGETGTGKELVARAIHYMSKRAAFPFVPVNCGALPETLLEDELFGHARGAFTDAHRDRAGLIAQAEEGTLFLDEIDALTAKAQVALLRVLQEHRFRPLGASREHQANVRVVTATNARLDHLGQVGTFHADLYYRLGVFSIHLPPLRERTEDILALAAHFLQKHTPVDLAPLHLTPGACAALVAAEWVGNIRELENAIIRGIHLSRPPRIEDADLGLAAGRAPWPGTALLPPDRLPVLKVMKQQMVEAFEKEYLTCLLGAHLGNVSRAARAAGKERRELGKLLKKYQIDPKLFWAPTAAMDARPDSW